MRLAMFEQDRLHGIAVEIDGELRGWRLGQPGYPGDLDSLLAQGADLRAVGDELALAPVIVPRPSKLLPPLSRPGKIICIGLNYAAHSVETGYEVPAYPTLFNRFATTLTGHGSPLMIPAVSDQFDYEGELAAVIGLKGKFIPRERALEYVAGYSVFNEASVRDYQFKTPQWSIGKNFDNTGGFGPFLVTPDELPPGCKGLGVRTRLNGEIMQDGNTNDMMFDVAALVSILSEALTLLPGDVIVTGTPPGVGFARKPPVFMKDGDVCEVEIDQVGVLRNPVVKETR